MANRLADETSPYLLQHKDNPVDWFPWGEEALARARDEDRPILLSIGYSACHWCHVMERESFEDPETAALMNERAHGGFGGAPKFPPASAVEFLLRRGETEMTAQTLRAMASGGMYDQVGGGFARYSVDPYWLVPHFEKMLYDNALLARAYLHGWQVTSEPLFRTVVEETLDWALREMRAPEGGFFSALDADSEGEEGRFYLWDVAELREVLEDDADGRLLRTWKDDRAKLNGYLEDHAYTVEALVSLYEATFEPRWFAAAREIADFTIAHFGDDESGGFFETA